MRGPGTIGIRGLSKNVSQFAGGGRAVRPAALPTGVRPHRIAKGHVLVIVTCHLFALLALLPWFFSWTGVILFVADYFLFGMLGINVCYHRLLTHRGFVCAKWFEHFLAVLGCCNVQDSPLRLVAAHRRHHQHSDEPADPHSPLVNFIWGHIGWLLVKNGDLWRPTMSERFAKDLILVIAGSEDWHNNHHADPGSAKHGHAWWEIDLTYVIILVLEKIGLARMWSCRIRGCWPCAPTAD
ncbi:MAG TPA: acyl-CoA desaturase [Pseudolabrys sp.]|nr:acyl-CoA desaturase [Pseudolabrys sp.]